MIGEQKTFDLTRLLSAQPGSGAWREYKIELLHKGRAAGDLYVDMRYVTSESVAESNARKGEAKVAMNKELKAAGIDTQGATAEVCLTIHSFFFFLFEAKHRLFTPVCIPIL